MNLKWTQYKEVDKFIEATHDILLANKYQNNIILQQSQKRKGQIADNNLRQATISNNNEVVLVIWQNLPFQMIYYFVDNKINTKIIEFFIENLIESGWDIDQIMGDEFLSPTFAKAYASRVNKKFENTQNLIVYRLDKLSGINMPNGEFRQCILDDLYYLPYWSAEFYRECNLDDVGKDIMHHHKIITEQNAQNNFVWQANGVPVSMTNAKAVTDDCMKIGGVYTPPYYRGNKYATAVVWSICNEFKSKYKDIMLYADANNPIANKCYTNVGFKKLFINKRFNFF